MTRTEKIESIAHHFSIMHVEHLLSDTAYHEALVDLETADDKDLDTVYLALNDHDKRR